MSVLTSMLRWLIPTHRSRQAARDLAAELGVQPVTASVLLSRGLTDPDAARRFLTPDLGHLHDPLLLTGMRDAVARIQAAIQAKEKILIYGDYDVDGTVSVVILKKAIEMAGGEASFHVPHRLKDGYGMRADVIERAAAMGIALIISVDTGIRASEVVREARERGIDVIVTDHHLPDAELPPALAVLNPNRRDCDYPDKNLCGAGVAFKLVHALLATLGWPAEKLARVMKSFLKLVAIATVADVVPLVGENRVIVKHGLDGLNQSKNPGLRAILELSGLLNGRSPSARQVAFQIAPRINAAGRMDDAQNVIRMFLTDDPEQARRLASQLHSLNQERRDTEAEIVRLVLEECAGVPVTDDQTVLVFSGLNWHRGVVGIVASRLVERFCRPVFVLSEEDGQAQGSGRSIAPFHLLDALESMPDLFTPLRRPSPGGRRESRRGIGSRVSPPLEHLRRDAAHARRFSAAVGDRRDGDFAGADHRPGRRRTAGDGAVRIRKSRAGAGHPGRRSGRSAGGDEGEASARPPAAGRPQPFPEGLEFRRTRRGFSGERTHRRRVFGGGRPVRRRSRIH